MIILNASTSNKPIQHPGLKSTSSKNDLDLIAQALDSLFLVSCGGANDLIFELARPPQDKEVLIRMQSLAIHWTVGEGGYMQAWYEVSQTLTSSSVPPIVNLSESVSVQGYPHGNRIEGKKYSNTVNIEFEPGQYLRSINFDYLSYWNAICNFKFEIASCLPGGLGDKKTAWEVGRLVGGPRQNFNLGNVACLSSYSEKYIAELGAYEGTPATASNYVAQIQSLPPLKK